MRVLLSIAGDQQREWRPRLPGRWRRGSGVRGLRALAVRTHRVDDVAEATVTVRGEAVMRLGRLLPLA
ncbi:MAG: hypothetical protein ACLP0J_28925 [Solirubrobacteraceae bacterium]